MPKIYCIILKHFWHFLSEKLKPTTNLQSTITLPFAENKAPALIFRKMAWLIGCVP